MSDTQPTEVFPDEFERLEERVARALEVLDEGGEDALLAFLSEEPESAEAVRASVEHLRSIGLLPGAEPSAGDFPERLGDFRLLRRIGGGGMGVVYLAVQETLGREVALKLIRPDLLYFEGSRGRFQREVEIVAGLQHPGIVPIYTVGSAAGLPYFAMEFVRGCTLDAVLHALAGTPTADLTGADMARAVRESSPGAEQGSDGGYLFEGSWEDTCLRIVGQVAEALEHAHRRGVVHRDVKPSNVMLTPDSRAMLLDFGLSSSESDRRLTATSSYLGTLDYLPPEALKGGSSALDARADVYSLGVLLYQLFTGRAPYRRESSPETLACIAEGRPLPPRKLAARLSWEAETVCLAAMEREPARRYASAADFARDLRNVLARRPIDARRASVWLRSRRWIQRHPAASLGVALGSLLVVGAPVLDAAHQRELVSQKAAQLEELGRAHEATEAQRARAQKHLVEAMAAVDRFLTRVGDKSLAEVPQMESLRRRLFEDAVEFQRGFLSDEGDDPEVRLATMRAQRRLGNLLVQLGRFEEAAQAHREAMRLTRELRADLPENETLGIELAGTLTDLGKQLGMSGQIEQAEPVIQEALATLEQILERNPDDLYARSMLVLDLSNLGNVLAMTGRLAQARASWIRAVGDQRVLLDAEPGKAVRNRAVLMNIVGKLVSTPDSDPSAGDDPRAFEQALREMLEDLAARGDQLESFDRSQLAACRTQLALALMRRGELEPALENADLARADLEGLVEQFPETVDFADKLASVLQVQAELAKLDGAPGDALEQLLEAHEVLGASSDPGGGAPEQLARHADVLEALAALAAEGVGEVSESTWLSRALECRRAGLVPFPEHVDYRKALAGSLRRALALAQSGADEARVEALRRELLELDPAAALGD